MGTYHTAAQIERQIKRLTSRIDLISFDVFDTLLTRRIAPPELSKVPAARQLQRCIGPAHSPSVTHLLDRRNEVEHQLRASALAEGLDAECGLQRLCIEWSRCYFRDTSQARRVARELKDVEIEAERSICRPVPGMADVLQKARQAGKRVVLISDMYLDKPDLACLLDHLGYQGLYDELFVSSDERLSKGSGRLFQHVHAALGVHYTRWLHVGDNPVTDVAQPRRLGIRVARFDAPDIRSRTRRVARAARLASIAQRWRGLGILECAREQYRPELGPLHAVGFWVLGPVLCGFMHAVLERTELAGVDRVIFPAREGFLLEQLYRKLKLPVVGPAAPPSSYAYLNRQSTYAASARYLGLREARQGMTSRIPSVAKLLARVGLEPSDFADVADECGLPDVHAPLPQWWDDPAFLSLLYHRQTRSRVADVARQQRQILRDYLEQIGFWDCRSVAIVDVGWNGTMQDALTCAFDEEPRFPRVHGWYLAYLGNLPSVANARSTYEGLLYDCQRDPPGSGISGVRRFLELLEVATRAPHATVERLQRSSDSGRVEPVLRDDTARGCTLERHDRQYVAALQKGIFDFADAYRELLPFQREGAAGLAPYASETFSRLARYPSKSLSRLLMDFHHIEDFGSEDLVHQTRSRSASPANWREFVRLARQSVWTEGYLASTGIPGLGMLANLRRLLKRSGNY